MSTISRWKIGTMLFLIVFLLGCASLGKASPPALELRTLRISPSIAGFEYQYLVCVKQFMFCWDYEMKREYYDLNNLEVRKKLIDMGFVGTVREKVE